MNVPANTVTLSRTAGGGRVTQIRVVLSEWTKLHSLRSTRWSLLVASLLTIGLPIVFAEILSRQQGHADDNPFDPISAGVTHISQLVIAVLGVLVITGEYSTGMIRATFTAVPRRLPVLWAKIAVYALVTFTVMLPSVLIAFFASQAIFAGHPHFRHLAFSDPGVARAVAGAAVYLMLVGIFALALGAILRNTAGGIATFAAVFFVIPPLLENVLPANWKNAVSPYLPDQAGSSMLAVARASHTLGPGPGLALFVGYTLVAVAVAALLLVRRDT